MHIRMKSTENGVNDGDIDGTKYEKGKTYDVGPELGNAFVNAKLATEVKVKVAPVVAEGEDAALDGEAEGDSGDGEGKKDAGSAPENKDMAGAPENK